MSRTTGSLIFEKRDTRLLLVVGGLPPGEYELTLEPEGFQPWTGTVRIEPGRATDLVVELR